jgi:branched-chain amino acid transport system substrate-binding protein
MKMQALTSFIAKKPAIKKVYLFNQDYQFGKQVSKAANEMLGKKRPDIKIVGDEFIRWARSRTSRRTWRRSRPPAPTRSSPATGATT